MPKKPKKLIIKTSGSTTITPNCAFAFCDYIQQFYNEHPDVYADTLAWKAARHKEAAAQ